MRSPFHSLSSSRLAKTASAFVFILTIIMIGGAIASNTLMVSPFFVNGQDDNAKRPQATEPTLKDSTLKVELVADGMDHPTSMRFIDKEGHLIILQKDDGKALLVSTNDGSSGNNGQSSKVIDDVKVDHVSERGLLGLAVGEQPVSGNNGNKTYVFMYYTESSNENIVGAVTGNKVYRYEWDSQHEMLTNPKLILDLPARPGPNHDAGKLVYAKDDQANSSLQNNYHLFAVIGDLNRNGMLQNFKKGPAPDDTSVIFRVNADGSPAQGNPFLNISKSDSSYNVHLSKYYAYGIRNSFGLAADPLTGTLWMTENGPNQYDEINVVKPGFNSGWQQVIGPIQKSGKTTDDLVHLPGSHYADPVFSWLTPIGITDIEFLNSTKLGAKYANNIFVGDFLNGNLYFFKVNKDRTAITFDEEGSTTTGGNQGGLLDLVADNPDEVSKITLGTGFSGGITDIETGPDGYLYILTLNGKLYRIVPSGQ
jgi:aldose sugar dehydrogenase